MCAHASRSSNTCGVDEYGHLIGRHEGTLFQIGAGAKRTRHGAAYDHTSYRLIEFDDVDELTKLYPITKRARVHM